MENNPAIIQQPWNLEADFASLVKKVEPPKQLEIYTPAEQLGMSADPKEVGRSILMNAYNSVKGNRDPFESKFEDASLSSRYAGKSVSLGDYKLDPKSLDARYSKTQSWGEQAFNNLKVGLANGGSMFLIGTLGLPDLLDNIRSGVSGEAVEQSDMINSIYDWRKSVEEDNSNFLSEQDNKTDAWSTIQNVLLPGFMTGSSGGWGKIFESLMYGVGAGASVVAQEALASMIAPGIGNALVLGNVAKMLNSVNSIKKYAGIADRIIDTSAVLNRVGSALGNSNRIKNAARYAYATTIGANGEAAFEGIEGERALSTELTRKYTEQNGHAPTGKDLKDIEKVSQQAGSARYWTNVALLLGTNALQFKRLFRNLDLAREANEQLAKQGLKIGVNQEGKAVASKIFELKSDWWNRGFQKNIKPAVEMVGGKLSSDFAKESFSEGFEEFTQDWIDKSVNNYYTWKLDHRGQASISQALKSIGQGFGSSWNTQGLSAFLSGAVAGVGQQALFSLPNAHKQIDLGKKRKEELQNTLDTYNGFNLDDFIASYNVNSVRGNVTSKADALNASGVIDEVAEGAVDNNDNKLYKDMESLSFFTKAEPYVSRGHGEILKEQFKFAIDQYKSNEEIQDLFGNPHITKDQAVSDFNNRVDSANESFSRIKEAFKNPYSYNSKNQQDVAKYWLYENHFLPELAYLDYRTKDLVKRKEEIKESLGEYYDQLKYFADIKDMPVAAKFVNSKISTLKMSEDYLRLMKDYNPDMANDYVKEKYLVDKYENIVGQINQFLETPSQEGLNNLIEDYHDAFTIELDQEPSGFYDKDKVMQKLSDHNRIVSDLDSVQKMLKSYLSKDGEDLFYQGFTALSKRENRKRDAFLMSEEFKTIGDKILEEYPNLTKSEVEEIIEDSSDANDVRQKATELNNKKLADTQKIEDIKTKVREKFIASGKPDLVEDYIKNLVITTSNEKEILDDVDKFLSSLNNKEFSDFKDLMLGALIKKVKDIDVNFSNDSPFLVDDDNQAVYDNLEDTIKVKYHEDLIDFYSAIRDYKDLPNGYVNKQKSLILNERKAIKELKEKISLNQPFSEQIGDYEIVKDNNNKYNLSLNGNFINSFDSLDEARKKIEEDLIKKEKESDVNYENINNIENKFENNYFDPEVFDKNKKRRIDKKEYENQKALKARLYNEIAKGNKTNAAVNSLITANAKFRRYTTDVLKANDSYTLIYTPEESYDGDQLPQERILKSVTTDAVVLSYLHETLGDVPLNTYKDPKTALGFVSSKLLRAELSVLKNQEDIDHIVDFIGDMSYYRFLQESVTYPEVYEILQENGFLLFKGTPQDQINLINEKQNIFDMLFNNTEEDIKNTLSFEREYTGINYENISTHDILDVVHTYALLKEADNTEAYNQYTFFFVADDVNSNDISNAKIDFVGLSDEFKADAREKINRSFIAKHSNNTSIYKGYYMLTTDSIGNGATYKLKSRELKDEDFLSEITSNGFENISIQANNNYIKFTYTPQEKRFNISDERDSTKLYIDFPINSIKDVQNLKKKLLIEMSKPQNWFNKDGDKVVKSISTDKTSLSFVSSNEFKPTTTDEVIATRQITGISRNNYVVSKVVPRIKSANNSLNITSTPKKTKTNKPTPSKTVDVQSLPYFVNPQEISIFVSAISPYLINSTPDQITNAIMLAYKYRESVDMTGKAYYINKELDLETLDKIATKTDAAISGGLKNPKLYNKLNLFTDVKPYTSDNPTMKDIEERVQELLKNCIR